MALHLEAFSPAEGVGIVRVDNKLRLVSPPYSRSGSALLREESLSDAIVKHGFSSSDVVFNSWEEVIDYLNTKLIQVRSELGQEIPDSLHARDVIEITPAPVLARFMDKVEKESIPSGRFEQAEDFLIAVLNSNVMTQAPEIAKTAAELLQRSKEQQEHSEGGVEELEREDTRFESLERHSQVEESTRVAKIIKKRHCVFAPC